MTPRQTESIGVIGAGAVGQTVTATLVATGITRRLLVASRTRDQAAALAADLADMRQATSSPTRPESCDVAGMTGCQALVIAARAAFTNARCADIRMGGATANAPLIRDLAHQLRGYPGTVLVVTNPVDLMTRLFAETSGCERVFGIGSNLDSARYRLAVARLLHVPATAIQGHVIGEHGDHAVVCASSTTVNGQPVTIPLTRVRQELRTRPGRISSGVGRTRAGPAGAVLSALHKALGLADGTEELTTHQHSAWLGIPLRFTGGQPLPCLPRLTLEETRQLAAAATKLRTAYQTLQTTPHPNRLETS
ncbi:saccharopine dehydrogenase NADP-binding domain-containing protein [Streptomyces smyrnaeus]|uniref:Saccharopine dehydrogenase NADP-binding domain-containing protein n=1 Tax=Streptomyces smyrnaeus TaxID=1387713 RepID=A0ABS3Y521_9ACTN|nr:saccharopine dehydrogenase NADP-binding domain-containing protein [Streptomyces smyrnaeus]MBO8202720.1 saccharopine dehydrogenase NADP-binding domain-containing protein [Streptomyces smyrnaeus]